MYELCATVGGPGGVRGVPILPNTSTVAAPTSGGYNPRSAPVTKSNPYSNVFQE